MTMQLNPQFRAIAWRRTGRGEFPYDAVVDGQTWLIQVGDFPAEALYTLLIDGQPVAEYDDWPADWLRPD